ncbi:MAG: hypothetical protein QOJ69_903, partial [Actinomycetota bacterium]|nr:hypothetical protein [Actinomycetota bacterium]
MRTTAGHLERPAPSAPGHDRDPKLSAMLELQRTAGNAAVVALLSEDRAGCKGGGSCGCSACGSGPPPEVSWMLGLQRSSTGSNGSSSTTTTVPRAPAAGGRSEPDPGVSGVQDSLGPGSDLGAHQARMESAFGIDFRDVRLHTDTGAANIADNLGARAFTVGSDIGFASGEYQP